MGSIERRERHRRQVRESIMNTARAIAAKEGWASVSVRKIADAIDYTAPILYEYFENKESLLEAIREEGFKTLDARFRKIKELYRSPEKQLTEVALAIWNFSAQAPEVFLAMFNLDGAYTSSKQTFQDQLDYEDNPVWEMIAAFKPRFAEAVNKTYREWWVITYGFIILKLTVAPDDSGGFTENLYMENVRRYLRNAQ